MVPAAVLAVWAASAAAMSHHHVQASMPPAGDECPMHQAMMEQRSQPGETVMAEEPAVHEIPRPAGPSQEANPFSAMLKKCPHNHDGAGKNLCKDCCCCLKAGSSPAMVTNGGVDALAAPPCISIVLSRLSAGEAATLRIHGGPAFAPEPPPPDSSFLI